MWVSGLWACLRPMQNTEKEGYLNTEYLLPCASNFLISLIILRCITLLSKWIKNGCSCRISSVDWRLSGIGHCDCNGRWHPIRHCLWQCYQADARLVTERLYLLIFWNTVHCWYLSFWLKRCLISIKLGHPRYRLTSQFHLFSQIGRRQTDARSTTTTILIILRTNIIFQSSKLQSSGLKLW